MSKPTCEVCGEPGVIRTLPGFLEPEEHWYCAEHAYPQERMRDESEIDCVAKDGEW